MRVRLDYPSRVGVDPRVVLVVTEAGLERAVLRIVGRVVGASDTIVDVLAEGGGVGTRWVTYFEAELRYTHEAVAHALVRG